MYVITKNGRKLPVDDSTVDYENDYVPYYDSVALLTDNAYLEKVWYIDVLQDVNFHQHSVNKGIEWEFVVTKAYDHEPTKEEIMYLLASTGHAYSCTAFVSEGYRLDQECEYD